MTVHPRDILLRVGGGALRTSGVLAVSGAGRGRALEVPYTFTRAAPSAPFLGQDGKLYLAGTNRVRLDYMPYVADGLVWPDGTPKGGPLLDGSRTNLVTWSDALSNWSSDGTPVVTDAFATLGDLELTLIEDDDAAVIERKRTSLTFTGDAVKSVAFAIRSPDTPADGANNRLLLRDDTAAADRLFLSWSWNADGTLVTPTIIGGAGVLLGTKQLGNAGGKPVYAVYCQTNSITAANTHNLRAYPTESGIASQVGKMVIGGVMVENAVFPSLHRQKTTGSTAIRAQDSLSLDVNFGPVDVTVLSRVYRTIAADLGNVGLGANVFSLGGGVVATDNFIELRHDNFTTPSRIVPLIFEADGDSSASFQSTPAGSELIAVAQFRNLTTAGETRVDVGSGFSAFSSPTRVLPAFTQQKMWIGVRSGTTFPLYGVLLDLIVARGLHSRAEMIAYSDA